MKAKLFLSICLCWLATGLKAQTTDTSKAVEPAKVFGGIGQYNHVSVGVNVGITNGTVNFFQDAANHPKLDLGYGVSLRDQLSHFFGLELNVDGGHVQGNNNGTMFGSKFGASSYDTKFITPTLSGVFQFGSVSFGKRAPSVDFYGSVGIGLSFYKPTYVLSNGDAEAYTNTVKELVAPIGGGIKFKLSDALALNIGYTVNFINGYNFSGFHTYPYLSIL